MIDTDKYEGHTPAPWAWATGHFLPDAHLITDAPKLLAEVKRLREIIGNREWTIKLCDEEVKRLREEIKDYDACLQNLWDKELIPEDTDIWDEVKELLEVD